MFQFTLLKVFATTNKRINLSKKLKILELFAGTRSIGKAFETRGHEVFSVEWNKDFKNIDLYEDISKITANDILKKFGWSAPCQVDKWNI